MSKADRDFIYNTEFALKLLHWFGFLFITYHAYIYFGSIQYRPIEIFEPLNYWQRFFYKSIPSIYYYLPVLLLVIFSNVRIVFFNAGPLIKVFFVLGIMWLNAVKWSFGYFSHVAHFYILALWLSVFFEPNLPNSSSKLVAYKLYISTLLFTYTLSAYWKIYYIIFNTINNISNNDWTIKKAFIYNAACGHIYMHETLGFKSNILQFNYTWEILFFGITAIMLTAFLSVLNYNWLKFTFIALIVFHLSNSYLIRAEFWVAPIVLLLFILPYTKLKLLKNKKGIWS